MRGVIALALLLVACGGSRLPVEERTVDERVADDEHRSREVARPDPGVCVVTTLSCSCAAVECARPADIEADRAREPSCNQECARARPIGTPYCEQVGERCVTHWEHGS